MVRPSSPIALGTVERNPDKLQEVYDLGVLDGKKIITDLKRYLEE